MMSVRRMGTVVYYIWWSGEKAWGMIKNCANFAMSCAACNFFRLDGDIRET